MLTMFGRKGGQHEKFVISIEEVRGIAGDVDDWLERHARPGHYIHSNRKQFGH